MSITPCVACSIGLMLGIMVSSTLSSTFSVKDNRVNTQTKSLIGEVLQKKGRERQRREDMGLSSSEEGKDRLSELYKSCFIKEQGRTFLCLLKLRYGWDQHTVKRGPISPLVDDTVVPFFPSYQDNVLSHAAHERSSCSGSKQLIYDTLFNPPENTPPSLDAMQDIPFGILTPPPSINGHIFGDDIIDGEDPGMEPSRLQSPDGKEGLFRDKLSKSHPYLPPGLHQDFKPSGLLPLQTVTIEGYNPKETNQPFFFERIHVSPMVDVYTILTEANFIWMAEHAPDSLEEIRRVVDKEKDCVKLEEFAGISADEDFEWNIVVLDQHGRELQNDACLPPIGEHVLPGYTIKVIYQPK
ncbi:uncharacterized protein [Ptychodera flava]|uniref:uncharacterized protein n=1 Tax=Ptychodera flava TaxID=63121 RepID=UPI00396A873E